MKRLFRRYVGDAVDQVDPPKLPFGTRPFVYMLVRVPLAAADEDGQELRHLLAQVITATEAAGGDVNQVLGDVVLVLFGVPLASTDVYEHVGQFIAAVGDLPVAVVGGFDQTGLYGEVGTASRRVVTGFSRQMNQDITRVRAATQPGVVLHPELSAALETLSHEPGPGAG